MELYSFENAKIIRDFRAWLNTVDPDDFKPPDNPGCRELAPEPIPKPPELQVKLGELALCEA